MMQTDKATPLPEQIITLKVEDLTIVRASGMAEVRAAFAMLARQARYAALLHIETPDGDIKTDIAENVLHDLFDGNCVKCACG